MEKAFLQSGGRCVKTVAASAQEAFSKNASNGEPVKITVAYLCWLVIFSCRALAASSRLALRALR